MSRKKYHRLEPPRPRPQDLAVEEQNSPATLVRVEALVAGGRGLGRVEGRIWLIEAAVPGDVVRALPLNVRGSLVQARTLEVVEPSPARREAPCPIQRTCGGCPWMILEAEEQRTWKRRLVLEALERIGRLPGIDVSAAVPSLRDLGYRNKLELTFGREGDRRVLGFHAAGGGDRIVDVERCLLQGDAGSRVLASTREYFLAGPGCSEPALDDDRERTRIVVRESAETGEVLLAIRGLPGPFESAEPFARFLSARHPELAGVVRTLVHPGRRGGTKTEIVSGEPWIRETLGGLRFKLPAAAFFQVNTAAAHDLVRLVLEAARADGPREVLDLYGGVGVFALALARRGATATVIEADPEAAACGKNAAAEAGIAGVGHVVSDVAAYLRSPTGVRQRPDLVIADPPRTGLDRGVAESIARLHPARIVLVSCDPPTLGRDMRALVDFGYAPRTVVPVDLFPQTAHVEAVGVLEVSS